MNREETVPLPSLDRIGSAWGDLAADLTDAYESFLGAVTPAVTRPRRGHGHTACCPDPCEQDPCHCACCVYDADLVVHARLGEQRVVPVRISNARTRTRQISLELSEFTTSGGRDVPIQGSITTRTKFELAACEREEAILLVRTGATVAASLEQAREAGRIEDVDDCLVGYADLRIQGCDVRPVRVAVALLPRDCDAYEVHCTCGCC